MHHPTRSFGDLLLMIFVGVGLLRLLVWLGAPDALAGGLAILAAVSIDPRSLTGRALRRVRSGRHSHERHHISIR
jgi:hypothetical protein